MLSVFHFHGRVRAQEWGRKQCESLISFWGPGSSSTRSVKLMFLFLLSGRVREKFITYSFYLVCSYWIQRPRTPALGSYLSSHEGLWNPNWLWRGNNERIKGWELYILEEFTLVCMQYNIPIIQSNKKRMSLCYFFYASLEYFKRLEGGSSPIILKLES